MGILDSWGASSAAASPSTSISAAVVRRNWEKWASTCIGSASSDEPLKAALLLNYDPCAPSRSMPIISEQLGTKLKPPDLCPFMEFMRRNNLQNEFFFVGQNQYIVTSVHEHWLHARCVNTSKPAGEGIIIMQTATFLLVALYEGSVGAASRAMAAVDQFVSHLNRKIL